MAKKDDFYGWMFTDGKDIKGHPVIEATKPDRVTMGEIGEHGIDPEIMRQRLKPRLLEQEVAASSPDDRGLWEERLQTAIDERDDARVLRNERALREQRRALRDTERGKE